MNQVAKITMTAFLALGIGACTGSDPLDRSQDPYQNYPDRDPKLGRFVPPTEVPEQKPSPPAPEPIVQVYRPQAYDVSAVQEVLAQRILNFVEGETAQHQIQVRIFHPNVVYRLVPHGLPRDANFQFDKASQTWLLTWTPKVGTVAQNSDGFESTFELELVIDEKSSPEAALVFRGEDRIVKFGLMVRKNRAQPTIEKISLGQGPFKEGQIIPFEVEVKDPTGSKEFPPVVFFSYDPANQSKESNFIQGDQGIYRSTTQTGPSLNKNGNWVFQFEYRTARVAEYARELGIKGEVAAEFYIVAHSQVNERASASLTRPIKIIPIEPPGSVPSIVTEEKKP